MSKLFKIAAILVFLAVLYVIGIVLWGSSKSVTFKKHGVSRTSAAAVTLPLA